MTTWAFAQGKFSDLLEKYIPETQLMIVILFHKHM